MVSKGVITLYSFKHTESTEAAEAKIFGRHFKSLFLEAGDILLKLVKSENMKDETTILGLGFFFRVLLAFKKT